MITNSTVLRDGPFEWLAVGAVEAVVVPKVPSLAFAAS
jgi:hypothetical protein